MTTEIGLWFRPPQLVDRRFEEGPVEVTKAVAEVEPGGAEGTKIFIWAS